MTTQEQTTGSPPFVMKNLDQNQWAGYVAGYDFGPLAPSRVVLHHTAVPTVDQWRGRTSMLGMQGYYKGLGWPAAPHIYVAPDGIWLATPMSRVGVHANSGNSGYDAKGRLAWYSIGVEVVGDYDLARPTGAVWSNSLAVLGGLLKRLGLGVNAIHFHREYNQLKSCPGRAVQLDWVKAEVAGWLAPEAPQPAPGVVKVHRSWHVNADALNVRQGPGTQFPVATQLVHGAWVESDEDHPGGWVHLVNGWGFVKSSYLDPA